MLYRLSTTENIKVFVNPKRLKKQKRILFPVKHFYTTQRLCCHLDSCQKKSILGEVALFKGDQL